MEAKSGAAHTGEFRKALGLFDSVMIVSGIMVGSGIFIVSAEITRQVGSAGWLLVAWAITGVLTVFGALSYGELAAMMPSAGGIAFARFAGGLFPRISESNYIIAPIHVLPGYALSLSTVQALAVLVILL